MQHGDLMSMNFSTGAISIALASMKTATSGFIIDFYSGARPANADSAVTGTLLGSTDPITFDNPVGKTISKPAAANWIIHCVADGTIGWCRIRSATDTGAASTTAWRVDGSCGINSGDARLPSLDATVGKDIAVTSCTLTGS